MKIIEEIEAEYRSWLKSEEQDGLVAELIAEMPEKLGQEKQSRGHWRTVGRRLRLIGDLYIHRGIVEISDGRNTAGWKTLDLGISYRVLGTRFSIAQSLQSYDTSLELHFGESVLLASYCALAGWEADANWLVAAAETMNADSRLVPEDYRLRRRMEPFVLWLFRMRRECRFVRDTTLAPPYQQVAENWADGPKVGVALEELCYFHAEQVRDEVHLDTPAAFLWQPFDLMPIEILLALSTRAGLGLEDCLVENALMDGPVAQFPQPRSTASDSLLNLARTTWRDNFE